MRIAVPADIHGNLPALRAVLAVFDGRPVQDNEAQRAAVWSAQQLDTHWRDELASWPISLELDGVIFCHGSPRSEGEGRPAAFWMVVEEGVPEPRETTYDVLAAVDELRVSGLADLEEHLRESFLAPADPVWVARLFEHIAWRGDDPGPPILTGDRPRLSFQPLPITQPTAGQNGGHRGGS